MTIEVGLNLDSKDSPYNKADMLAKLASVPKGKLCLTKFAPETPHMVNISNVLGLVASYKEVDGVLTFDVRPLDSMKDEITYLNNLSACGIGEMSETLSVNNFLIAKMFIADDNFKALDFSHLPLGDLLNMSISEKNDWPTYLSFTDKTYLLSLCNDFAQSKRIHTGNLIWARLREIQRPGGFDYLMELAVKFNDRNNVPVILTFPFELQAIKSGGYKLTQIRKE